MCVLSWYVMCRSWSVNDDDTTTTRRKLAGMFSLLRLRSQGKKVKVKNEGWCCWWESDDDDERKKGYDLTSSSYFTAPKKMKGEVRGKCIMYFLTWSLTVRGRIRNNCKRTFLIDMWMSELENDGDEQWEFFSWWNGTGTDLNLISVLLLVQLWREYLNV